MSLLGVVEGRDFAPMIFSGVVDFLVKPLYNIALHERIRMDHTPKASIALLRRNITPSLHQFLIAVSIDLEEAIREQYREDPHSLEQFDRLCSLLDGEG